MTYKKGKKLSVAQVAEYLECTTQALYTAKGLLKYFTVEFIDKTKHVIFDQKLIDYKEKRNRRKGIING